MDKAAKSRNDCRVLMTGDEGNTKAGIDIFSATAIQLEQAREMGRDATLDGGSVLLLLPCYCESEVLRYVG